jgi:hypothetical protein
MKKSECKKGELEGRQRRKDALESGLGNFHEISLEGAFLHFLGV